MKIGVIILSRFDSIRLPGKILKPILGKPTLSFILERIKCINPPIEFIVATSNENMDDPIAFYCKENKVKVFRGSKLNVAKRFLSCAEYYNLDFAIRINGDNIFTDPVIIQDMVSIAQTGRYNFLSNVQGRTFPPGVSVEIVNVDIMRRYISKFNQYEQEHVMPYFYYHLPEEDVYHFKNSKFRYPSKIHLALDTIDDFQKIKNIIKQMKQDHWTYSTQDIINFYQSEHLYE